ncbi:hypothetical protein ILUMI_25976 [Ignelater luminosus]|uniref:C3H1-type domain-containing protein n=1 Tax=Ignelater luminosus TaxID=2038154 RepID=A0A8K0C471_IGNLU|nr:hypothetical protein ILUMI_25976 [Ignelater luminosus]
MSDSSEDLKTDRQGETNADSICRDFIRGVCGRKFCKYKHENDMRTLNFCHDFQNATCPRPNCKFIHCTPDEEEEYKKTGEMSNQILAEATRKAQLPGTHPVCNQFRKGMCRRTVCKYRHISKEEEEAEIMDIVQNNSNNRNRFDLPNFIVNNNNNNGMEGSQSKVLITSNELSRWNGIHLDDAEVGPPAAKRRFIPNDIEYIENDCTRRRPLFKGYFAGNPPMLSGVDARTIMLEEENSLLHKEIAQLKRQVSDLTATNEFLLDQNATLRMSNKRNGSVTVPAVSITNTLPQNNTPPQAQQVIRTVTASVATVPVSIATVSTGNPVSANHVSIAGCPAVSIAPAQILAPSQQILVTTNPPSQLAIANSSQAQLAIAQQNLATNLAQQSQSQLTSQAQQLALASTQQQLTSQAQHVASQQLVLASASQGQQLTIANNSQQLAPPSHLTTQAQQLGQQLTSQAQQLANQQQLGQQLTSQAQQLALANTTQQLTSQAQQLALANSPQQLAVANVPQQLALAGTNQQLLAQQSQQMEMHRNNQMNAINTSQAIALSNATQPMVSYPIMTQSMTHALSH